jgi:mRNA-degrading endonuclease toxin of MazEF toxin-antitoxin module
MASLLTQLRWHVVIADSEPVVGHEQGGERRALVVSYDALLAGRMAAVCPITAARSRARYPGEVPIPIGEAGQTRNGTILVLQVRTISLDRTTDHVGVVTSPLIRRQVRERLAIHFGLDIPEDEDLLPGS